MDRNTPLTPEELSALQETRPFLLRASAIPKIMAQLGRLREALRSEIPKEGFLAPEGVDQERGQIAKGEHHEGLPYAFMDFPKLFHRDAMFTYRVFFWWGHPAAFAIILKGPLSEQYKERLLTRYDEMAEKGFHLATDADPWIWRRGAPHTLEITRRNQVAIRQCLPTLDFLKIERFLDLEPPATFEKRFLETGIATFRDLFPLIRNDRVSGEGRLVYFFCPNLFWSSRVMEAGTQTGVSVQRFDRIDDLRKSLSLSPEPDMVVLDIDALKPGGLEVISSLRAALPEKVLLWGVGSHVDIVSREAAEKLGCDKVWVRSEFTRRVGELLLTPSP